jgi:hypothetical protein
MKKNFLRSKRVLHSHSFLALVTTTVILMLSGCVTNDLLSSDFTNPPTPSDTNPYKEIYDAGLTKYVGKSFIRPASVTQGMGSPRIDIWNFSKSDTERGPLCMRGTDFFIETRDGSSDQLLIFLEGGGVCLNEICAATSVPLMSLTTFTFGNFIGIGGILNHADSNNPMANYDLVHIPYCDGSIFMGDVDRVLSDGNSSNGTQDMAYQRGLQNLTAGIEVAKYQYPNPSRIVLAGTSGGGYGIMAATALVRYYYPDTEIVVIADSGAPILRDNDKDFVRRTLVELNGIQYIPLKTCPDCIANGHVTKVVAWALERDKNFRVASMSHTDDAVIGDFFMQSPPPIFRTAMLRETESLTSFGSRVHRFITPGTAHTYLINVGVIPGLLQKAVFGLFGSLLFTGDTVTPIELAHWSMGSLYEKGIDLAGKEVSVYEWITNFLNDPKTLKDVVNVK